MSYEQKQFQCFICKNGGDPNQYYYFSNGEKFSDPEHTTKHTHVIKSGGSTKSYTPRAKVDYTERDANMKKMQESKQTHEKEVLAGETENAKLLLQGFTLLADAIKSSFDTISISIEKHSNAIHELAQSNRLQVASKKGGKE